MRTLFRIAILALACFWVSTSVAQVPKDFVLEYENRAGQLEMGTVEKIKVKDGVITVNREGKIIGEGAEKKERTFTYPASPDQMEKLVNIVKSSGFMDWPQAAEAPHESHADEYFRITLDGKTVRHSKWEEGNQEAFRILWTRFNDWYTDARSARF